ncbi:MAG: hypothetical protein IPN53_04325 [Comamonadaceae bacterium]|nr:hypothetical protein [Comamonadaceae bacterium]
MTCCEDARMESKAPISLGKGNLPVRVKAWGVRVAGIGEKFRRIDAIGEFGEKRTKG